jgi:outer membrane protein TolC
VRSLAAFGLALLLLSRGVLAEEPAPPVHLADLEARALLHNPALAAAGAALEALDGPARGRLEVERQRMLVKFRTLFFHTLANQRRVETRERLAAVAREAAGVTDRLFNVGAADSPDRLAIENEARLAEAALSDARFELEQMRALLAEAVGEPEIRFGPLEGDLVAELPKIDREEWRLRLLRESPSLQEVQAEVAAGEKALARARGTRGKKGAAAAEAALAADRLRAEQIRITLELGFAEVYAGYRSGVDRIALYRGGVLERAERAYRENLERYQRMTAAYPQVLVAQRGWYQMEDAYLDAVVQAWSAAIDIQALLPYELPQNLAPPIAAPSAAPDGRGHP